MTVTLALFALVGTVLVGGNRRLGRVAFLVAAIVPAGTTGWVCAQLPAVIDGRAPSEHISWVGQLGLSIDLRLDGLAATMTLVISVIGVAVLLYAWSYFDAGTPDLGRLAGLLVLFAGAMVGLVQADNLLALYTFWEITSITSYLLIGTKFGDPDARAAALHALLVTSAGGLAMLAGFVLLGHQAGTYRISELATALPDPAGATVTMAMVLILLGAFTKSAQYPFHAWLPGAMAAPTPVSAYLHSATMVKAGVYLIARMAPVLGATAGWRPLVLVVGLVTLFAGGLRALRQYDLKLLLAFGTVSQLGLLVVLFGAGTAAATTAGWVLLVAHALFKATLFMVVGILDHQTGTRDVRSLPALDRSWRWVEVTAAVSAASMAGVPLAAGFVAKEAAYAAFTGHPFAASTLVLAGCVVGSMLTVAYAVRFYWGAFVTPRRRALPGARTEATAAPSWAFVTPAVVLAAGTLVLGVAPGLLDRLATASVIALYPLSSPVHLAVWHGFNLPLVLSAVTLAGGAVIAVAPHGGVQRVLATGGVVPRGEALYLLALRAVGQVARRVTAVVQNGSLPVYAGVILVCAAVAPLVALAQSWHWPGWPAAGPIRDVPIVALLVMAALGAAAVRQRFAAALFLGVVGYGMAALFVASGDPDLALTQVTVETLSTVVFVLVLRRLPDRFQRRSTSRRRVLRIAIAALVAAMVFVFGLVAAGSRTTEPISEEMVDRSVPDGHGRNVVNVILVDFRGLDTMGEITVLAAAAIGAVALARAGRRHGRPTATRAAGTAATPPRIVFVDVSVQVIFHAVLMLSLWLLFAGHNQPGGGFVGGLLAGSAITLRYVAGGMAEVRRLSRFRPWTVLGVGLLLAMATAGFPLLGGGSVLDVAFDSVTLPLLGTVNLSSALLFDVGVYITVVGVVLMAFEAFGEDADEEADAEAREGADAEAGKEADAEAGEVNA